MRRPSQDRRSHDSGGRGRGLAAVVQLAADVRTWADLPIDDLEILLFSLGAFIEKAGTGGGLFRRLLADGCADVARLTGDFATAQLAVSASRCAAGMDRDCTCRYPARR